MDEQFVLPSKGTYNFFVKVTEIQFFSFGQYIGTISSNCQYVLSNKHFANFASHENVYSFHRQFEFSMQKYANDSCDEQQNFFWSNVCLRRGNWKAQSGRSSHEFEGQACHGPEWCHLHTAAATIKLFWFNAANMSLNYTDVLAGRQWHAIINSQQLVLTPHISRSRLSIQLLRLLNNTRRFDKSPAAAAAACLLCRMRCTWINWPPFMPGLINKLIYCVII